MMDGLAKDAGRLRAKNAGVYDGERLIHAGTPAAYVPEVMADLFAWLKRTRMHPLVASCVFHYEFEFVHPFSDGMGARAASGTRCFLPRGAPSWHGSRSKRHPTTPGRILRRHQRIEHGWLVNRVRPIHARSHPRRTGAVLHRRIAVRYSEKVCAEIDERAPRTTVSELAEALGISKRTTERLVSELKREGEIRRVGSPRKGRWEVVAP